MPRTFALIVLIVVALIGVWLLWPRAELRAPVEPAGVAESLPARPASNDVVAVTPLRPRPSPAESDASESRETPAVAPAETRASRPEQDAGEKARFCALVVAREDGRPIEKAEVFVNDVLRTSTDAAGRFEIEYRSHRVPAVRVTARGFGPVGLGPAPGNEVPERARRVALERAASLVIALQVPPGQTTARVTLRARGYEISQDPVFSSAVLLSELKWEAIADSQGVCTFEELPPSVRFVADVIGSTGPLFRAAEPIVLAPGEKKRLEWDVRGCELVGHVYEEDGKAAPGVKLWLMRTEAGFKRYAVPYLTREVAGHAKSADDGSFRFGGVAPGTWVIAPEPVNRRGTEVPADAIAPAPLEVTIPAGESRFTVDVHIARGLYIRGTLVAPDGTTGVHGAVLATSAAGEHLQASAEKDGAFVLGPLARGTFTLTGSAYNTYLSSLATAINAPAKDVVLLTRTGAEVAGKVIDQSGAGVQSAITIGGDGGSLSITRTQPDGAFRFDGLEPGRYTVFASTTAGQAGVMPGVMLSTGTPVTGLEVVLEPGAKLRIRYEGSGVGSASIRRNGANIGGDGIEGGRNKTQVVAPGRIAVSFRYPGREQPEVRELDIAKGEDREIVFKEPAGK